jgi:putative NIF3 family GTP cyclohydrolase 1 type 2
MVKVKDIIQVLEDFAPLRLQESYDNAGLILGSPDQEITSALVTVDVTEQLVDEAIEKNAQLIVAHHPLIFSGLKKITGKKTWNVRW